MSAGNVGIGVTLLGSGRPSLVTDLDGLVRRLADAGVEAVPDGEFPGHRRIYVDDPFGNRLEFLQPL